VPLPDDAEDLTIIVQTGDKIDPDKRYYYTGKA
jgi:hypothetical protein